MWETYHTIVRLLRQMGPEEYFLIVAIAVGLGFFCLRGFGSRAKY